MFSLRLKRKPDFLKFTRFEAGIGDERLPDVPSRYFLSPCMIFARAWASLSPITDHSIPQRNSPNLQRTEDSHYKQSKIQSTPDNSNPR